MRVLYLVGNLEAGGLERFVTNTALHASRSGAFTPVVMCLAGKHGQFVKVLEAAGVEVHAGPAGWTRSPAALLGLRRQIAALAPDIVHSQVNSALVQQFLAAGDAAFCVTERSCYQLRGAARVRRAAQFHLLEQLGTHFSGNSEATSRHLARLTWARGRSLTVLPNGVAPRAAVNGARQRLRARMGVADGELLVGCVARMHRDKRHTLLVEAFAEARAAGAPLRLCLCGDGPELPAVTARARALGVSDQVAMVGTVEEVDDYLAAFDLVCLLSSREGMPNAVLEAMSAGKPIIATAVGAVDELLDAGRAGVVLPAQVTASEVARSLQRLAADPALRQALGAAAATRAANEYSVDRSVGRLLHHYHEVLHGRRG